MSELCRYILPRRAGTNRFYLFVHVCAVPNNYVATLLRADESPNTKKKPERAKEDHHARRDKRAVYKATCILRNVSFPPDPVISSGSAPAPSSYSYLFRVSCAPYREPCFPPASRRGNSHTLPLQEQQLQQQQRPNKELSLSDSRNGRLHGTSPCATA